MKKYNTLPIRCYEVTYYVGKNINYLLVQSMHDMQWMQGVFNKLTSSNLEITIDHVKRPAVNINKDTLECKLIKTGEKFIDSYAAVNCLIQYK